MRGRGLTLGVVGIVACAAPATQIIDTRELTEAGRAPAIVDVVDLGGGDVPATGDLRPRASDRVAVIGEALWIRGRSFGRQPTVQIGGRPATVIARTGDGGILVRVPPGTPSGPQVVDVTQEYGRAERALTIKRYGALLSPGGNRIAWVEIDDSVAPASETEVPDARFLRLSADGRAAYVLSGSGRVTVIELPAPGGPALGQRLELGPDPIVGFTVAPAAHLGAVVRAADVVLLDLSSPLRPVRRAPLALPAEARSPLRAELSPDGRLLAVVTPRDRRLIFLDCDQMAVAATVALPIEAGGVADMVFSQDGSRLWVATGQIAPDRPLAQPTRVHIVQFQGAGRARVAQTVEIPAAGAPGRLATGRVPPLASGAAIRLPSPTVYLSAAVQGADRSAVFRVRSDDPALEILGAQGRGRLGAIDTTPDGRWLLAAAVGADGAIRILSAPADGRPGSFKSVPVLRAAATKDASAADLRVQP